jgi:hypothetical protein
MIPMTCRNCTWFVVHTTPRPDEPSDFGCRERNWAGYVYDPNTSQCSGAAFVAARDSTAKGDGK